MSYGYEYNPPEWQKDAIATELGWRHPVTNELLVSVPGGVKKAEDIPTLTDIVVESEKPLQISDEVVPVVIPQLQDQPVKRGRGRPRKNV